MKEALFQFMSCATIGGVRVWPKSMCVGHSAIYANGSMRGPNYLKNWCLNNKNEIICKITHAPKLSH